MENLDINDENGGDDDEGSTSKPNKINPSIISNPSVRQNHIFPGSDFVHIGYMDEEDEIMRQIMEESIKTAELEQQKRQLEE
jgi:hypothetical protein